MSKQRCAKCGQAIDWATIDGRPTPLHNEGSCTGIASTSKALDLRHVSPAVRMEPVCWPTNCPECKKSVYFIRHNGGSVWLDELGHPWPKHECMYGTDLASIVPAPPSPPDFPTSKTQGKILNIEAHGGSFVIFVQWKDKGISMYQCPKQGILHVNFKLYYDPFDNEKYLRTIEGRAIPIDSLVTKRSGSPTLNELQMMITNARHSGTRYARMRRSKFKKNRKR